MSVWGTELSIAIVLFVAVFPIALWFLTYHHYHRHGTFRGWSAILTIATFAYTTGVIAFTLFPFPERGLANCLSGGGRFHVQLIPLSSLSDIANVWQSVGFPSIVTSAVFLQVVLNIALLIPLGMLLAYRYRNSFGFTILAGFGVSLLIETVQGTAMLGIFDCPYRLADVDDLITNTAGAAVGWAIGANLIRWLPDASPEATSDLDVPGVSRRVFAGVLDWLSLLLVGIVFRLIVQTMLGDGSSGQGNTLYTPIMTMLDTGLVAFVMFLLVPLLRDDRATPGQIATWLALDQKVTGERATSLQILLRFSVRWLPIVVGAFISPVAFLVGVAVVETASVVARKDSRSASGVLAGTTTTTRRSHTSRVHHQ